MDKLDKDNAKNGRPPLHKTLVNLFFLLTLLIIIAVNIGSYYQISKFTTAHKMVIHTYQVTQAVNNLLLNILNIESLVRGYLITDDESFLKKLKEKIDGLYDQLILTQKITITYEQQKNLHRLEPLFKEEIELTKKVLFLTKKPEIKLQEKIILIHRAQNLSEQIRYILLNINEKELNLLKQRNEIALKNLNQINAFIIAASTITLFIIFIGLLTINRQFFHQLLTESKLRNSEALLKGIIDGSNDLIAALDLNYRFIVFNHSYYNEFKRIFGKTIALGMSIKEALSHLPEEQKKALAIWKRALSGEEFVVVSKFGDKKLSQLPYEITCSSIRDNQGNLIGASHIVRNIQNRVEAEKTAFIANEKLAFAYQELKTHDKSVSLLNQMDTLLQTCSTVEEALEVATQYCKKLLPFAAGILYLTHSSGNYLVFSSSWNDPQNSQKIFSPDECWALRQGQTYRFFNQGENICCKHYVAKDPLKLCFCVPLLAQNDDIGLLYIEIKKTAYQTEAQINRTADSHELIINNLGGLIALSIANIKLKDTLKIRSVRDPLTNLYNRAYLNESLEREIHRTERTKTPLTLIMIDIDHFKNINDTFGHQAGDLILQTIGDLLLKQVRKSDIACRYGGEEFLLALYSTPLNEGIERAEHIREKLSHMKFHFSDQMIDSITASFGIASYSESIESMEKLIRAADQALYESKKMGRNKVTVYQLHS